MRNLLLAVATGALLVAAVPASAQVYMGADPGGAGVQVGPFGFGVGPRYGYVVGAVTHTAVTHTAVRHTMPMAPTVPS